MEIRVIEDGVLVSRVEAQERSEGGIIIPEGAKERPLEGIVITVGPGKCLDSGELRPMSIRRNDRVLFGKFSGAEMTIDGEDFVVLRESDILAIIA